MSFDYDALIDPRDALRLLQGYGAAVVGETLYIEGGRYYASNNSRTGPVSALIESKWLQNTHIFSLDLTVPFASTNISELGSNLKVITKDSIPSSVGGSITALPDGSGFVHVGGRSPTSEAWIFTTSNNGTTYSTSTANVPNLNYANGATAISRTSDVVYYLGGTDASSTASANLVAFDTKLKNSSIISTFPQGGISGGSMVWLPAGDQGILVHMGGIVMSGGQQAANPMTKINVYDIASSKWFTQTAVAGTTAGTPDNRSFFTALTPTPLSNYTHWEIFFYGGLDSSTNSPTDELWALSLPTFQWFNYYDFSGPFGKANRTSVLINDAFLAFVDMSATNVVPAQSSDNLIAFFDVTAGRPGGFGAFNASKRGYAAPLDVELLVNANTPLAAGGFVPGLQDVFSRSVYNSSTSTNTTSGNNTTSATTTTTPASTSSSSPSSNSKPSSTPVGAIAGGVIGGIVVLAILAFGAFMLWRRKRHNPRYQAAHPDFSDVPVVPAAPFHGAGFYKTEQQNSLTPSMPPAELGDQTGSPPYHAQHVSELENQTAYQPPVELDSGHR